MSIPAAYVGVILIWSTTPLAIQWSGEGAGFLFGVAARMGIGLLVAMALLLAFTGGLRWGRRDLAAYGVAGGGIFGSMLAVYWAAGQIPSGWISVVFGLAPILTGIMAYWWLNAPALAQLQWAGLGCALAGLAVIFGGGLQLHTNAVLGLAALLVATLIHAASAVGLKRINAQLPALAQTSGGLLVAAPLFMLAWWIGDGSWPQELPPRTAGSILYLGLCGSVLGFTLYFYVLRHVDAVRVSLITLITPINALLLGHLLNGEAITRELIIGAALVILGLALFQFGGRLNALRNPALSAP